MERNIYSYDPQADERVQAAFPALMSKVYIWMTMALIMTGLTAFYVANNESLLYTIYNSGLYIGLLIIEMVFVVVLSASIMHLPFFMAGLLFAGYSILNGATLSIIFLAYNMESIVTTFFVTAGTFGAMSLIGLFTKRDLSTMGRFLYMMLIGLVIASIVNIFMASNTIGWALTFIGVFVFSGLTAYDTQKTKVMLADFQQTGESNLLKIALFCSLSLYLDFINLFLYFLRIFGDRK